MWQNAVATKNTEHLNFEETIRIPTKVLLSKCLQIKYLPGLARIPSFQGVTHHYLLSSVIVHRGNSIQGGHYVTCAQTSTGWYLYDDTAVSKIKYG